VNNVLGTKDAPLTVWGGAVPEMTAPDLPEGASAYNQNMDFRIGSARTRAGTQNVYSFPDLFVESHAGFGANAVAPQSGCQTPWTSPANIAHDTPGTYASVTLNAAGYGSGSAFILQDVTKALILSAVLTSSGGPVPNGTLTFTSGNDGSTLGTVVVVNPGSETAIAVAAHINQNTHDSVVDSTWYDQSVNAHYSVGGVTVSDIGVNSMLDTYSGIAGAWSMMLDPDGHSIWVMSYVYDNQAIQKYDLNTKTCTATWFWPFNPNSAGQTGDIQGFEDGSTVWFQDPDGFLYGHSRKNSANFGNGLCRLHKIDPATFLEVAALGYDDLHPAPSNTGSVNSVFVGNNPDWAITTLSDGHHYVAMACQDQALSSTLIQVIDLTAMSVKATFDAGAFPPGGAPSGIEPLSVWADSSGVFWWACVTSANTNLYLISWNPADGTTTAPGGYPPDPWMSNVQLRFTIPGNQWQSGTPVTRNFPFCAYWAANNSVIVAPAFNVLTDTSASDLGAFSLTDGHQIAFQSGQTDPSPFYNGTFDIPLSAMRAMKAQPWLANTSLAVPIRPAVSYPNNRECVINIINPATLGVQATYDLVGITQNSVQPTAQYPSHGTWNSGTHYLANDFVVGTDGLPYIAKVPSGPGSSINIAIDPAARTSFNPSFQSPDGNALFWSALPTFTQKFNPGPVSGTSAEANMVYLQNFGPTAGGTAIYTQEFTGSPLMYANLVPPSSCSQSQYLQATAFGFNIPTTENILGLQVQVNGNENLPQVSASITAVTISSNILTVFCANTFTPGESILLAGLTNATFLNNVIVIVLSSSGTSFTAAFTHSDYPPGSGSSSDTGTASLVTGALPSDAVFQISLIRPANIPGDCGHAAELSPTYTFQLQTSDSSFTVGGPVNTWGLGANLTPAVVNDPMFGFNVQAFAPNGEEITFDVSGVDLTVFTTTNPPQNFNYIKTFSQPDGTNLTLALDAGGTFWQEQVEAEPNQLRAFYTAIEPNTFAKSVTADEREYIALSDLTQGTDMPRQYDATYFDRVSQVGPGAAPVCSSTVAGTAIVDIEQNPAIAMPVSSHDFITISSGSGSNPGNVFTFTPATSFSRPGYITVGTNIVVSGLPSINGFQINNDPTGVNAPKFYTVSAIGSVTTGSSSNWIQFQITPSTFYNAHTPSGVTVQATQATVTTSAQVPYLEVGGSFSVTGNSVAGYDSTWTVLSTPNASQLEITSTVLSGNVATYTYVLVSGAAPTPGQFVTVTATTNGNGIFNVVNQVITSASTNTFSVTIVSPNISSAAEQGNGIIFGTQFVFDPLAIFGTGTGGTIETAGIVAAGPRQCVVLFQTRNGGITPASDFAQFDVNEGASSISVSQIPRGPADVVARILAFTPAGTEGQVTGFFFYIPTPVTVQSNGQNVTYSSTVINDNVTTQVTLSFPDGVLLSSTAISVQGRNYQQTIELGSCLGVVNYAERLFWWGENNKIQNMQNLSFDGGAGVISATQNPGLANQTYPLGWTIDPTVPYGGSVTTSPLFGDAYQVQNTTGSTQAVMGRITQTAAFDEYGIPIIAANTTYSVRLTASALTPNAGGTLVVDLYRPSLNSVIGSFTVALSTLTPTSQIFTGPLLTIPISTQPGTPPPPPPPPPGPPVYQASLVQQGTASMHPIYNDHRDNTIFFTYPSPVTKGDSLMLIYTSFHYNSGPGTPNRLTVTDNNGNQWVAYIADDVASGSEYNKYVLIAQNAVGGSTTVHIDEGFNSHGNSFMLAHFSEWNGLLTPITLDGTAMNSTGLSSTFNSGTITTANANDLIISDVASNGTAPTGFTALAKVTSAWNGSGLQYLCSAYKQVSSTGTFSPTWTGLTGAGLDGLTAAFRLTPINPPAPPPNPNPQPTPFDLEFRIYGANVPNGGNFLIDRIEPFPTQEPVLSTQARASYANNFDAYDQVTGNLGCAGTNSQPIVGMFPLFDNLYIWKSRSLLSTVDDGKNEPLFWNVKEVSNKVGICGINAYDVGDEFALGFSQGGMYLFLGSEPIKISQEIQPIVDAINWQYGNTIWLRNDIKRKRIYIGVPIPTGPGTAAFQYLPYAPPNANPTTPNMILMCSYRDVNTAAELASSAPVHNTYTGTLRSFDMVRKWSFWTIPCPYADFITRADTTYPIFFCNGVGNSKVYQLNDTAFSDDGLPIQSVYTTYGFIKSDLAQALGLGSHRLSARFGTMNVSGNGELGITVFTNSLNPANAKVLPPVPLSNPNLYGDTQMPPINSKGNRFFFELSTHCINEWFEVSRLVLSLDADPWTPIRGSY
jgi:hypothetical protein